MVQANYWNHSGRYTCGVDHIKVSTMGDEGHKLGVGCGQVGNFPPNNK